ncbi:MAG TPA: autotransporter outer membrane beta-barrel domain-containing protein [Candidatus Aphodousia faecavium]|nr:autotransporter outer membrane beta-barrel domain-containing protein [Candidatus Aphodousia faecavium]
MNKVYKSIWNAVTRSWTAVSEWQTSRGKRSTKNKKTLAVSLTLLTSLAVTSQFAYAAGIYGIFGNNTISLAPIFIGDNSQTSISQEDYTSLNHVRNSIGIELSTVNADINKIDPFEQSTKGFIQAILYSENLVSNATHGQVHEVFDLSNYNNIVQGVTQGSSSQPVAYFSYATGQRVYNLYTKQENESVLDKYRKYTVAENGQFYFDADSTSMGFTDDGIAWNEKGDGGREGIYLLTLLTDINLASTLQLNVNNTQDLAARLNNYTSSTGNIEYVGSGADSSTLNIIELLQVDENGQAYNNANTYSGTTTVTDLTLNLKKEKSLGNTTGLTVKKGVINVGTSSEVVRGNADFVTSSLNLNNQKFEVEGNATFSQDSKINSTNIDTVNPSLIVGKKLTIHSDNSQNLNGAIQAESALLTNIDALGNASLYVDSDSISNGLVEIKLNGSSHIFDNQLLKAGDSNQFQVRVTNSSTDSANRLDLTFDSSTTIESSSTSIGSSVTLRVTGISQLGNTVEQGGNSTLEITKAGNDETWNIDSLSLISSYSEDVVEVKGSGFTINSSDVLKDYSGWLRLSDTVFELTPTTKDNLGIVAGLSLGANSTFKVTGNQTVNLNRLGWTSDIDIKGGEKGGVLDLTGFTFSKDNSTPALSVTHLDLNGIGSVNLNTSQITGNYNPQDDVHLLDADDASQLVYQIIRANEIVGDASNIRVPTGNGSQDVTLHGASQSTAIGTAKWGYDISSVLEGDDSGLWLSYNLREINLNNSFAQGRDDYLTFNLSQSTNDGLRAKLTGTGYVLVTNNKEAGENNVFRITNRENTFNGTFIIDSGIAMEATVGSLGNQSSNAVVDLRDGANLSISASLEDDPLANRTQYLSGLKTSKGTHEISIGANSVLALNLNEETTWSGVKLAGTGTLGVVDGTLNIENTSTTAGDAFSGRLYVVNNAILNLVDGNADPYTFKYLSGNGTVGVGLNALVGADVTFTGDYFVKEGKTLTINQDSASQVDQSDFYLDNSATLIYNGVDDTKFGNSLTLNDDALVKFIDSEGEYIKVTDNDHILSISAVDSSINFDWSDVKDTAKLYDQNIDPNSQLTYEFSGNQNKFSVDFSGTEGRGDLWLNFTDPVQDLSLTASSGFEGTLGYRNAALNVGDTNNGYSLGNSINFQLGVGTGSTLITHGQTTLNNGLLLESDSTLDFTSQAESFVQNGLSANGINMAGTDITVGGPVNIKFDVSNIDIAIDQDVTQDTFLDALSGQTSTVINVIDNIQLKDNQKVEDLAGNFNLEDKGENKVLDIIQDGENVASVSTGIDIVGSTNEDGTVSLGIGGAVTHLNLIKELELDVSQTQNETPEIHAQITGDGSIKYVKGQVGDGVDVVVTNSSNNYSGSTIITDDTHVRGVNSNVLGLNSALLQVGSSEIEEGLSSKSGTLTLEATSGNLEQRVKQFVVEEEGTVNLLGTNGSAHIHINSDSQEAVSAISGKLTGSENSQIWTEGTTVLNLSENADVSEFKGTLVGTDSSVIRYTFTQDQDWTLNTQFEDQSKLSFEGTGTVNVLNDSDGRLSVRAQAGTVNFANSDTKINRLESSSDGRIQMNGLLTVNDFTSEGGILEMDVSLGTSAETETGLAQNGNDGLLVNGTASGSVGVLVADKNQLKKGQEESITLIQVDGDASDFSAQLVDENGSSIAGITAGGYDYVLLAQDQTVQSTGRDVATGTDYILTSKPGEEEKRNTTVTAGSYIGIAYAAQLFDLSLHDRVGNRDWINPMTGEKQTTSLWMHHTMSHERFRDSTSQLRMRTTSNTTMLGSDLVQFTTGDSGLAYAGLMGGYGTMDTKSRSKVTNLHSKAETDAWGVGAYAGWKANSDGQTGPYVDGWVMFTHANSDVTGVDQNTEDVKGQGLSASLEAGWGFKVGSVATKNGKVANFTVEPHASVTWFGMQYDEIHNEAQDVKFEGENNVRTRLGARAILTQEGNNNFNAFVEANWVHNTQEYGATISGLTVDQAGSRNQGEGRIGVDWRVTDSLSVWGRVGASFGSDNYNEREGSIGVRYQF